MWKFGPNSLPHSLHGIFSPSLWKRVRERGWQANHQVNQSKVYFKHMHTCTQRKWMVGGVPRDCTMFSEPYSVKAEAWAIRPGTHAACFNPSIFRSTEYHPCRCGTPTYRIVLTLHWIVSLYEQIHA